MVTVFVPLSNTEPPLNVFLASYYQRYLRCNKPDVVSKEIGNFHCILVCCSTWSNQIHKHVELCFDYSTVHNEFSFWLNRNEERGMKFLLVELLGMGVFVIC
jgi:hypothetical protein